MKIFDKISHLINGKEYYQLTKVEKKEIRDNEYKQILSSYIMILNVFLLFSLSVLVLIVAEVLNVPINSMTFYLIIGIIVFLTIMSILLFIQKFIDPKIIRSIKFDIPINIIILVFLTIMTIKNFEETGHLAMYAVGIITFAFLVKMRPLTTSAILLITMISMTIYIYFQHYSYVSISAFLINVIALNLITILVSRWLFVDDIFKYTQKKLISQKNKELDRLSKRDYMTDIHNRRAFAKKIEEPIKTPGAICLIDLDGLKLLNDALGHTKGDCAIILTTDILSEVFAGSFFARIGGDEFVVIMEEVQEKFVKDKVDEFREKLESNQTLEIKISASVGYAMIESEFDILNAYKKAENIMYHLKLGARSSRKNRSMEALLTALHDYTGESERHCHRVGYICQQLLSKLGYNRKAEQDAMKLVGQLHDIGKLSIPQNILQKKDALTDIEWMALKQHSEESYKIVCGLIDDKDIANSILYHHEHWDGSGYPYRLKGEEIPVFARVLSVADAYDAMLSDRQYQKKKTHEEACKELIRCSGTQFAPQIVEAFLSIPKEMLKF